MNPNNLSPSVLIRPLRFAFRAKIQNKSMPTVNKTTMIRSKTDEAAFPSEELGV